MCVVCELWKCSRGDHLHKSRVEGWGSFCGSAINIIDSVGHIVLLNPPPTPSLWAAPANLWVTVATKSKSIAYFRARAWNYIIFHLTFAFCLLFPFPHSQFFAFCFSIFLLITTPRAAVGNQGVSNGNNGSGSCAWAASHWLGVQISALIWFLIIILCSVSSRNTRRAQQRKAAKSRKRISRVTRLKVCSKIFSFIAACQVCCVRVHGAMRVCLCVCVRRCVLLFHLCNLLPRFVSFRLVWFRFGFCFYAFTFSTAFTAPFINNSHWFLLFLATPDSTQLSSAHVPCFSLSENVLAYFFVYFLCTLLFALCRFRLRFTCKQLTEFHREMHKEKSGICWGYGEKWSLSMIKRS